MAAEREQRGTNFVMNILQRTWWDLERVALSHPGLQYMGTRQREGLVTRHEKPPAMSEDFRRNIRPDARPNPKLGDAYMTLHSVPHDSVEWSAIQDITPSVTQGTICAALRVQNYTLMDTFWRFCKTSGASDLCVGFHGCHDNRYLETILLHNLNPSLCEKGNFGQGAYIADRPKYIFDGHYASYVKTPPYRPRSGEGRARVDQYAIVILFACNRGKCMSFDGKHTSPGLPSDHGAFVDNERRIQIMCFQEYERLYPAYVLLYRIHDHSDSDAEYEADYIVSRNECQAETSGRWDWQMHGYETVGKNVILWALGLPNDQILP